MTLSKVKDSQHPKSNAKITQVTRVTQPAHNPEKQGTCATSLHNHTPCDQQWGQAPKVSHVPTHDKTYDKL